MPLLETTALSKRFGGVSALHDVSVVLERDETLGMIGPNGSGKTTFVNAVTGNLRADSGTLMLDGVSIAGRKPNQLATLGLVRTYQAVRVFGGLTTRANLGTANLLLGDKAFSAGELVELLDWLRLDRVLDKDAGSLTLFEQRRLELAMRLVLRPKLVMLDEPVGGLAVTEVREMIKLLSELKARTTLFVIEHTMRVIRELADRVVVLVAGEKIADGPPVEILRDRRVIEQYLGTAHA
jgi:ABC-type branched-subunit amino acid transport system ATPase component